MRISHFFIDRPIFAAVISVVLMILGAVSFFRLPIAQYPEIAPPLISVTGQYPGASAEVVASTVVTPIEQQINGVENMIYMASNSTADGRFSIAVSFELGTNLDIAQVQVQNRVAIATPRLPSDVRNIGVVVQKSSPDLMMVVHLYSPDKSRNALFISNYATLEVTDAVTRVDGVGSITVFGARDYSMRVWLDPDRLQSLGLTATDVTNALQAQNIQVASGILNQPPISQPGAFQIAVQTLGRLADPEEFASIVIKQTPGAVVRLKDVATVDLAALDYSSNSYLDHYPAVGLAIFQRPGSNALETSRAVRELMETLSKRFPSGVKYDIFFDPTQFIRQSVDAVIETIGEAIVLVVLVVIVFLQTWRAAIIPLVAIPGIARRYVLSDGCVRVHAEQPFAVRAGACDRHRGRRRDRRGGECRAQYRDRPRASRGCEEKHERGRFGTDRDRAGAVRGVRAVDVHHRHIRAILPAVRADHFRRDRDFSGGFADAVAGDVRAAAQGARSAPSRPLVGSADPPVLRGLQLGIRPPRRRRVVAGGPDRAARADHVRDLSRGAGLRPQSVPADAGRLYSAGRCRLHDRRDPASARRFAGAHRRGAAARDGSRARRAGRIARRERGRILRRDFHQRAECRRDLPDAQAV